MSLLLNTHVVPWWLTDDPTLAAEIKERLDHELDVYLSPATIWEVAIKQSLGKLDKPADLHPGGRVVIVSQHPTIKILRQAGLTTAEFQQLLR
jgi:PIN domain nuclease of toxin-antitoxin system